MASSRRLLARAGLLALGVLGPALVVQAPSFSGRKVALTLDVLARPEIYLRPPDPRRLSPAPADPAQGDTVSNYEPSRRFAASEVRAGRVPLWTPQYLSGTPFAIWPKYSPFELIYYLVPSPFTLVWMDLSRALVAALGAYLCFRRALAASPSAAVVGAACYPLTGAMVLWQGFPLTSVAALFPWLLLAADTAARRPSGRASGALAAATCATLLSGMVDVGLLALLASGLYVLWSVRHRDGALPRPTLLRALGCAALGWALGVMLAAPYLLPFAEYCVSGARLAARLAGADTRPPAGPLALPQVVLPDIHGSTREDSLYLLPGNLMASAAAAHAGLLATLVVAPFAFRPGRRCRRPAFWLLLAFLGLAWILDVPPLVALMRLPYLNVLKLNRAPFVAAFAILALAVAGLDAIASREARARARETWVALTLLLATAAFAAVHAVRLPALIQERVDQIRRAKEAVPAQSLSLRQLELSLGAGQLKQAALLLAGLLAWLALRQGLGRQAWLRSTLGVLMVCELVGFAHGRNPQGEPALYYPRLPALATLLSAPADRVLPIGCLPPNLPTMLGLRDVRGYDAVDPARYVGLLEAVADPRAGPPVAHARTQNYVPEMRVGPGDSVDLPGVLDMLCVRHVVLPAPRGFRVLTNPEALPRAFVPRRVRTVADAARALARLRSRTFDARAVAYLEAPEKARSGRGRVGLVAETPGRVQLALDMDDAGLVVLADQWAPGWRAELDGRSLPVLRANYVLRAVEAPAGRHSLVFRYDPLSFRAGLGLMALALLALGLIAAGRARGLTGTPLSVEGPLPVAGLRLRDGPDRGLR
jgi:hypothetical protein